MFVQVRSALFCYSGYLPDLRQLTKLRSFKINSNDLGKEYLVNFQDFSEIEIVYANENHFWCPMESYAWVEENDFNATHCWNLPSVSPSLYPFFLFDT